MTIFPKTAEAAVVSNLPTLPLLDRIISTIINPLIVVFMGIALVVFLWGVVQYIKGSADGKDDKGEGKDHMLWGVIGLTIMFSALGIMSLISKVWTE